MRIHKIDFRGKILEYKIRDDSYVSKPFVVQRKMKMATSRKLFNYNMEIKETWNSMKDLNSFYFDPCSHSIDMNWTTNLGEVQHFLHRPFDEYARKKVEFLFKVNNGNKIYHFFETDKDAFCYEYTVDEVYDLRGRDMEGTVNYLKDKIGTDMFRNVLSFLSPCCSKTDLLTNDSRFQPSVVRHNGLHYSETGRLTRFKWPVHALADLFDEIREDYGLDHQAIKILYHSRGISRGKLKPYYDVPRYAIQNIQLIRRMIEDKKKVKKCIMDKYERYNNAYLHGKSKEIVKEYKKRQADHDQFVQPMVLTDYFQRKKMKKLKGEDDENDHDYLDYEKYQKVKCFTEITKIHNEKFLKKKRFIVNFQDHVSPNRAAELTLKQTYENSALFLNGYHYKIPYVNVRCYRVVRKTDMNHWRYLRLIKKNYRYREDSSDNELSIETYAPSPELWKEFWEMTKELHEYYDQQRYFKIMRAKNNANQIRKFIINEGLDGPPHLVGLKKTKPPPLAEKLEKMRHVLTNRKYNLRPYYPFIYFIKHGIKDKFTRWRKPYNYYGDLLRYDVRRGLVECEKAGLDVSGIDVPKFHDSFFDFEDRYG